MQDPNTLFGRLGNRLFQMAYIYAKFRDGEVPDIYLQDYTYFDKYREDIRKIFSSGINATDYVAVHIRRTDYCNNPFYIDLWETDYYEKAIAEFPGERFMIFSDDIDWCKENFIGKEFTFNEDIADYEAMNSMASCKGIIGANSSFAFWSAYLSNAEKIIMPKQWFTDGVQRVNYPPEWLRI